MIQEYRHIFEKYIRPSSVTFSFQNAQNIERIIFLYKNFNEQLKKKQKVKVLKHKKAHSQAKHYFVYASHENS